MERWRGKVAVVTGASSGIGAGIAQILVESGLKVAGVARRKAKIEELANQLSGQNGKLYAVGADMCQEEQILQALEWTKKHLGPINILVNCAGVLPPTNLLDGDTKLWKQTLETNVLGLSIATREAVKDMRANNVDGHIIHINGLSGHGISKLRNMHIYSASKFAVTALTESLRMELNSIGSKIKITSLSPGLVASEMTETYFVNSGGDIPSLKPRDIADAVFYILSTPPHVQVHELMLRPVGQIL